MDFSDVKKKLNQAKTTSLTKHYKVSVAAVVDACLALVKVLEDQGKDDKSPKDVAEALVDELKPLSDELTQTLEPRTFGELPH